MNKKVETIVPYGNKGNKTAEIESMFDSIAHRYDFLNHSLSLGIDKNWRKQAIKLITDRKPNSILDIATGTGDLAIQAAETGASRIVGLDLSANMLEIAKQKVKKINQKSPVFEFIQGDSLNLPFADQSFDVVMVAFGIRNFENIEKGLTQMHRVLKKGGILVILELSNPTHFPYQQIFSVYSKYFMPLMGRLFSKDSNAYKYLPESVYAFPEGKEFSEIMRKTTGETPSYKVLRFQMATLYTLQKS